MIIINFLTIQLPKQHSNWAPVEPQLCPVGPQCSGAHMGMLLGYSCKMFPVTHAVQVKRNSVSTLHRSEMPFKSHEESGKVGGKFPHFDFCR